MKIFCYPPLFFLACVPGCQTDSQVEPATVANRTVLVKKQTASMLNSKSVTTPAEEIHRVTVENHTEGVIIVNCIGIEKGSAGTIETKEPYVYISTRVTRYRAGCIRVLTTESARCQKPIPSTNIIIVKTEDFFTDKMGDISP